MAKGLDTTLGPRVLVVEADGGDPMSVGSEEGGEGWRLPALHAPLGRFSVLVSVQVSYQIRLVLEMRRRESLSD